MSVCEMQREFTQHELDFEVARYSLETALVSVTRELTTGQTAAALPTTAAMPPSAGVNEGSSQAGYTVVPDGFKPHTSQSIGTVYCELLAKLETVKLPSVGEAGERGGAAARALRSRRRLRRPRNSQRPAASARHQSAATAARDDRLGARLGSLPDRRRPRPMPPRADTVAR